MRPKPGAVFSTYHVIAPVSHGSAGNVVVKGPQLVSEYCEMVVAVGILCCSTSVFRSRQEPIAKTGLQWRRRLGGLMYLPSSSLAMEAGMRHGVANHEVRCLASRFVPAIILE